MSCDQHLKKTFVVGECVGKGTSSTRDRLRSSPAVQRKKKTDSLSLSSDSCMCTHINKYFINILTLCVKTAMKWKHTGLVGFE